MFTNRVNQIRGEGNVAKLHVALSGVPEFGIPHEDPIRHRLLISPSMRFLEQAFNCSKYAEISAEPPLEITFPSAYNDALAPPGHHVMSVSIAYAPYRLERGWESERAPLTERVISRIARFAPNLPDLVVDHQLLTPVDIEREFKVVGGHWHHGEMTIHQSFMMRPLYGAAQYDTPVYHLFLCGAGCHPGGGLTGLPGYLAARRMLEMHR